ncbi:MAG: prepilin-type N-terminal cleavage/methylation domain-containing protein [Deltaproteobacteria bacterium]|nr:prepilin-type N-terminal cleavage/methylation domain-containing protein [Deltaproteobacteria bacterium]
MQTCPGEKGFTLIETLMAIAIIAIGLLALAALQTTAISGTGKANKHSMAVLLAEDQIENYKNIPYDSIPSSPSTESGTPLSSWGIFTRTTIVQDGSPVPGSKTITVTVSWPDKVPRSVVFQTIIAQTGI